MKALRAQLGHLIAKHGDHEVLTALAQVFAENRDTYAGVDIDSFSAADNVSKLLDVSSNICSHNCLRWEGGQ